MKEPTYRQTLGHAWEVVWHNKILWILGLLSVFLGQIGFSDIFGRIWAMFDFGMPEEQEGFFHLLKVLVSGGTASFLGTLWLVVICGLVATLVIFLATVSQGALITYVADWFKTRKHNKLLDKAWQNSLKHFWSIFWINIVRQIFLFLLLAGFALVVNDFFNSTSSLQGFMFAVSSVAVLFASLFLSAFSVYALCYVVLDGKGLTKSLKKAWALFSEHFLVSLEVGLFLMLLNLVLVLAIVAASFFAFLPAALIWVVAGVSNTIPLAMVGLVVGIFLFLLLVAFMAGIFNAFTISTWVFLFIKMHKEGVSSRLIHLAKYMFSR